MKKQKIEYSTYTRKKRQGLATYLDYTHDGDRYRPLVGYNLSPAEVEDRVLKLVARIRDAALHQELREKSGSGPTFRDAVKIYWQEHLNAGRRDSARPKSTLQAHAEPFMDRPLADFTRAMGRDYIACRLEADAAADTVRREIGIFNRILNLAVGEGMIAVNPWDGLSLPAPVKRQRVASTEELLRISAVADPEMWRIAIAALTTCLREGKILEIGYDWAGDRTDGHWLLIPSPASRLKGTPGALPLSSLAYEAIVGSGPALRACAPFPRWNPKGFSVAWKRTCVDAGVSDLHFHDLRHTASTILQNLGISYEIRQAIMGHRMPGKTADYSHGGPGWDAQLRAAITALNDHLVSEGISVSQAASQAASPTEGVKA